MATERRAIIFDYHEHLVEAFRTMLEARGPWIVESVSGQKESVARIMALKSDECDLFLVGEPRQHPPDNEASEEIAWLIQSREVGGLVVGILAEPLEESAGNLPPSGDTTILMDYVEAIEASRSQDDLRALAS